jgi:hypothetical protein
MLIETDRLEVAFDFKHLAMSARAFFVSPAWQVHQVFSTFGTTGIPWLKFDIITITRYAKSPDFEPIGCKGFRKKVFATFGISAL